MTTYKLYYFDFRARGELPRLMFAAAGVPFEDVRLPYDDSWEQHKHEFPFQRLPVLEVDGKQIAQSQTIARYLSKEFGFAGKNKWEEAQADMFSASTEDILIEVDVAFFEKDETRKAEALEHFKSKRGPSLLQGFEAALKRNSSGYLVGDGLTYADLAYFNILQFLSDALKADGDEVIANFPESQKHSKMIQSLPRIAKWISNRPKGEL